MAIAFVSAWTGVQFNSSTGGSTAAKATSAGNFIGIVTTLDTNTTWTIATAAPSNTVSQCIAPFQNSGDFIKGNYVENITGGASTTVTITTNASRYSTLCPAEWSGVATSSSIDQTNTGTGSGTTLTSGNVTISTPPNQLLLGGGTINTSVNSTFTGASSFTARSQMGTGGSGGTSCLVSREDISSGTYAASMTWGSSGTTYSCWIATFKAPASGGAADTPSVTDALTIGEAATPNLRSFINVTE